MEGDATGIPTEADVGGWVGVDGLVTNGELGATGRRIYDYIQESHATGAGADGARDPRGDRVKSIGTVGYWLDKLEAMNLIRRDAGKNRSIQLRGESPTVPVPLVGEIRAGRFLPGRGAGRRGTSSCPASLVGRHPVHAAGARRLDDRRPDRRERLRGRARNGTPRTATSWPLFGTEDGATIKHFSRKGDRVRLLPANNQYKPIPFRPDGRILGKVVHGPPAGLRHGSPATPPGAGPP